MWVYIYDKPTKQYQVGFFIGNQFAPVEGHNDRSAAANSCSYLNGSNYSPQVEASGTDLTGAPTPTPSKPGAKK
jgi:hypothetical protein